MCRSAFPSLWLTCAPRALAGVRLSSAPRSLESHDLGSPLLHTSVSPAVMLGEGLYVQGGWQDVLRMAQSKALAQHGYPEGDCQGTFLGRSLLWPSTLFVPRFLPTVTFPL